MYTAFYAEIGMVLYENRTVDDADFLIYAAEEPERSRDRRSQMAEICASHKNLRPLRAKGCEINSL